MQTLIPRVARPYIVSDRTKRSEWLVQEASSIPPLDKRQASSKQQQQSGKTRVSNDQEHVSEDDQSTKATLISARVGGYQDGGEQIKGEDRIVSVDILT